MRGHADGQVVRAGAGALPSADVVSDDKLTPVKLIRKRLDDAGVDLHLAALAKDAQAIEVRVKGAVAAHSETSASDLADLARRLKAGELVAVQVRFFQDGVWWCDTIVRKGDDFRLVRMQQEELPAP